MKRTLLALALAVTLPSIALAGDTLYTSDFEAVSCGGQEISANIIDNTDIARGNTQRRNENILAAGGSLPTVIISADDPLAQPNYGARRATCSDLRSNNPKAGRTAVACGGAIGIVEAR